MNNTAFLTWDLKEIVTEISKKHPEITQVYLFGSRAYKTNSFRSDIDLLAISNNVPVSDASVNAWLHKAYPPVDLFCSYDSVVAKSVINGSCIQFDCGNKWGFKTLFEQLDAKLLWDKESGFANNFSGWIQQTLNGVDYKMSIIPSYAIPDFSDTVNKALQTLEASGVKTYYAGSSLTEISESIIKLIETGLTKPTKYQARASNFSYDKITIKNEYDFQALIQFVLRPIFPDINPEPFMINFDGNSKFADFAIMNNKIIIEAKWIDTAGKKNDVIKTIEGLSSFYTNNPNIQSLLFLVLHKKSVQIDQAALGHIFSFEKSTPPIYVRFMSSDYAG